MLVVVGNKPEEVGEEDVHGLHRSADPPFWESVLQVAHLKSNPFIALVLYFLSLAELLQYLFQARVVGMLDFNEVVRLLVQALLFRVEIGFCVGSTHMAARRFWPLYVLWLWEEKIALHIVLRGYGQVVQYLV